MSARPPALAVSPFGAVAQCPCCARLQLHFGSVIASFDSLRQFTSLMEVVDGLCAEHPPWQEKESRLVIRLGRQLAFALHPEELHELDELLRTARIALDETPMARSEEPPPAGALDAAEPPPAPGSCERPWQPEESS